MHASSFDLPFDMPLAVRFYIPSDMPFDTPFGMPCYMPFGMPFDAPCYMPSDMPFHVPSDMPFHVPSDMPFHVECTIVRAPDMLLQRLRQHQLHLCNILRKDTGAMQLASSSVVGGF